MSSRDVSRTPLNIADRLAVSADRVPDQPAIIVPHQTDGRGLPRQITYRQLDSLVTSVARGLVECGVEPGARLILAVPPGIEFIALTFGIFRAGAVCTFIDPGMGRKRVLGCLDQADPDGFVAIARAHLIRRLLKRRYPNARHNVIVGPRWLKYGAVDYDEVVRRGAASDATLPPTTADSHAAIIFTSGSTGPPKGVLYQHAMFDAQVELIRDHYGIEPGGVDVPGFPLFALFNLAMQVTSVLPDMDPSRPAQVDPHRFVQVLQNYNATQSYGSPALWNRVGRYCEEHKIRLPQLQRILSAGAPVPLHVLQRMTAALGEHADVYTPYGATECLPVASMGGRQVLQSTAALTADGRGTCIGTVFDRMDVRIIRATSAVIPDISRAEVLPQGEIGEIIVRGPVATREYFQRPEATAAARIPDGTGFWHRMGDVGYVDESRRLWFCGRRTHIVHTAAGPMYSICCEAIFNNHRDVYRSALVGVGPKRQQSPVIVIEPEPNRFPSRGSARETLIRECRELAASHPLTRSIEQILLHRSLPVDTRHNVKINREQLAIWAAAQTGTRVTG